MDFRALNTEDEICSLLHADVLGGGCLGDTKLKDILQCRCQSQYLSTSEVSRMLFLLSLSLFVNSKTLDSEVNYVGLCHYIIFLFTELRNTSKKSEGHSKLMWP